MLTGPAKGIQHHTKGNKVSFTIVTGPATKNAPKGLKLFGQVRYQVECTARQWNRARFSDDDDSDLVIEGFQEPREQEGKAYIAVVAMGVSSFRVQKERKLKQLMDGLEKAKVEYAEAKEMGAPEGELKELAGRLVGASDGISRFREKNPGLRG